jgi:hypothetical protein
VHPRLTVRCPVYRRFKKDDCRYPSVLRRLQALAELVNPGLHCSGCPAYMQHENAGVIRGKLLSLPT